MNFTGHKCQIYVMDLCYYKLYRLRMFYQFYTPRDVYDLGTTSSSFKILTKFKVRIRIKLCCSLHMQILTMVHRP